MESLRHEVLEDLTLGPPGQARGYAQRVALGVDMVNVRWARGGLRRSGQPDQESLCLIPLPARSGVSRRLRGVALHPVSPACLPGWPSPVVANGRHADCTLAGYQLAGKYQHFSAAQMLLFPAATFLLLYALLRSMLLASWRGGIVWRGTFYSLHTSAEGREVKSEQEQFSAEGFVLAGGRSTRMGKTKPCSGWLAVRCLRSRLASFVICLWRPHPASWPRALICRRMQRLFLICTRDADH